MKKLFFLLIAANGALSAFAQAPETKKNHADSVMSRWVVDVNLLGGGLMHDITAVNPALNYNNALNSTNIGTMKFSKGISYGGELQLGYFFDRRSHWGVGAGVMYQMQKGDVKLSKYNVDYQSTDNNGNIFRQMISSGQEVKESLKITNVSIPVVLKYKYRFSEKIGIAADAGILYNIQLQNNYTTDAKFDYEAAYKYGTNGSGNIVTSYDNGATPASTDLVITKNQYLATHPGGDAAAYLTQQRTLGYNVGSGIAPNKTTGSVNYVQNNIGFIFHPTFNYFFSDKVALTIGGYYMYQGFTHAPTGQKLTDKVGEYNSMLSNVTTTNANSYGGTLGFRFFFGKLRDRDHDGIADRNDKCPNVYGVEQFGGCPDTDGDGIPDSEDSCVDVPGLKHFHGCPDSDGDGIPNFDDACPYQAGPAKFMGCPDTDNDGIPDSEDKCPNEAGPASNNGCPLPTPTPTPTPPPPPAMRDHDMTEPVLFELGKSKIHESSLPILAEAIMELNTHENAFIQIDGHTDNTGSNGTNDALSFRRANAVKRYLSDMGANPKRMIAIGHGSRVPVADNKTAEGRAKNRRVIMTLKHSSN
jgi:outer membrane protein OmpA-like peptidoglycan-associated protein